jgi:hypothetical protein
MYCPNFNLRFPNSYSIHLTGSRTTGIRRVDVSHAQFDIRVKGWKVLTIANAIVVVRTFPL